MHNINVLFYGQGWGYNIMNDHDAKTYYSFLCIVIR